MKAQLTPSEFQIQCTIVDYLEILKTQKKITAFTAVNPQPGKLSFPQQARMKKAGLRSGFPDLIIIAHKNMLCLEIKREKGGEVSPEQTDWLVLLSSVLGVVSQIAYGYEEAKLVIDDFVRVKV